jgi:hypothetical protein
MLTLPTWIDKIWDYLTLKAAKQGSQAAKQVSAAKNSPLQAIFAPTARLKKGTHLKNSTFTARLLLRAVLRAEGAQKKIGFHKTSGTLETRGSLCRSRRASGTAAEVAGSIAFSLTHEGAQPA